MNSVSSTKVALCFLRVCKILRTGEIGEGGGESECSQTAPQTPSRGQSPSRVSEGARSKHSFSKTRCPMQPLSPLQRENLTPAAYASSRPGDGEGGVGKHSAWRALKIHLLAGCSGACLHPPNHSGHQGAGPLAPAWRPCRPSALGREHGLAPGPASVSASAIGGGGEKGEGGGVGPASVTSKPSCWARARGRSGTGRSGARGAWIEGSRPWAGEGEFGEA